MTISSSERAGEAGRTAFTEADFNGWRFNRNQVHFNGGKVFFGYGHRCIDQPRLLVIDKYFKADRRTERSYLVDGRTQCGVLSEALAALSEPFHLNDEERNLLEGSSDDWLIPAKRHPLIPLVNAGLLEIADREDGFFFRRTDAGRAALAAKDGR